ncbi:oligopeptide/dipeptide ABC transporter ATP-binding protein [Microbacterium deminutum]|uniref:ABC transporter ATP-binding protein n=1 Tax=Microbacterium deminutum TaxID=344164 RepID=A0ABP5CHZ9_9MICO
MTQTILEVTDLTVRYGKAGKHNTAPPAVDHVSFRIERGETVGLVGESGSGKTTIGKAILGLQAVTEGSIVFNGVDVTHASRKERRAHGGDLRAIFQDPFSSLDPRRTIGASLAEPLRIGRVSATEAERRVDDVLQRVRLPAESAQRYPRQFSGGQRQRISIARALITNPSLVICDEPVSALDLSTQAHILNQLADLRRDSDLSYLFIAHDISVVGFLAQRVVVLYRGAVMETGPSSDVTVAPLHPFTRALIAASPVPRPAEQAQRRKGRAELTVGTAAAVSATNAGCPFAARCPFAADVCVTTRPALSRVGQTEVACHGWDPSSGHPGLPSTQARTAVVSTIVAALDPEERPSVEPALTTAPTNGAQK